MKKLNKLLIVPLFFVGNLYINAAVGVNSDTTYKIEEQGPATYEYVESKVSTTDKFYQVVDTTKYIIFNTTVSKGDCDSKTSCQNIVNKKCAKDSDCNLDLEINEKFAETLAKDYCKDKSDCTVKKMCCDKKECVEESICSSSKELKTVAIEKAKVQKKFNVADTFKTRVWRYKVNYGGKWSSAYCIQPGKEGPFGGQSYVLNHLIDVRNCSSVYDKSIGYPCGLAEVFYQAYNKNYNELNENDYTSINIALRLWINYYYKVYNKYNSLSAIDKSGYEKLDDTYTSSSIYTSTVLAILDNYSSGKCSDAAKYKGNILCDSKNQKNNVISRAISLFNSVRNAKTFHGNTFMRADTIKDAQAKIVINEKGYIDAKKTFEIEVKGLKDVIITDESSKNITLYESIYKSCYNKEDSDECKKAVKITNGNGVSYYPASTNKDGTIKIEWDNTSGKDSLIFKVINYQICYESSGSEVSDSKAAVYFGSASGADAKLRIYYPNNNSLQIMVSYFNESFADALGASWDYKIKINMNANNYCTSSCVDKCTDTKQSTDFKADGSKQLTGSCGDDNSLYSEHTIEDPGMSCIINSCSDDIKNKYEETKVSSNQYCKVYCRNTTKYYLKNKVDVYAGMQFRYDLGSELIRNGVISSQVKPNYKLTSVVIEHKQCTSVIDNDKWLSDYNSASKESKPQLLYDLYNCNLYSGKDIPGKYRNYINKDTGTIRDYLSDKELDDCVNGSSNCNRIDVSYDEGYKVELGKNIEKHSSNKTYYCNRSDCFNNSDVRSCSTPLPNMSGSLPNNKFATIYVDTQYDYYLKTKFKYETYTGNIITDGRTENTVDLPLYSYPINSTTKSGKYNIKYSITNIAKNKVYDFNNIKYTCNYNVYNTTKKYDCNYKTGKCSNSCYEVKDGVAVLKKECMSWKSLEPGTSMGVIYRNVALGKLFPASRVNNSNWSDNNYVINPMFYKSPSYNKTINVSEIKKEIESSSEDLYKNDNEHLEYSYTLSPDSISKIKEYNKNTNNYLDNTLTCNKYISVSSSDDDNSRLYYDCKSSFLRDITKHGVVVNAGGNK